MNQDAPAGFGSIPIPMRFGYFGTPSTAVDSFDNTMDMNTLMEPRAFFDSCISETPPGFSTDESMSPSSLDMNEMSELIQASPDAFYDSVFLDSRHVSSLNPALSSPFVSPVLDFTDENIQPFPSHHDISTRGLPFANSRPPTRNSFSGQNISMDAIDGSSPTSSSGQCEGRDHEFYRLGPEADGLYHCPFDDCDFPPKTLKCEYHKHIDSHLKPFRCRKAGCANQAFSSVACRLRHEREMHKMHNAEEYLCRYDGPCDRKLSGNGFARSFNRGDHEKRVHHISQENARSKGRPKGVSSETNNTQSRRNSAQRKLSHRDNNVAFDESSMATIGATVATSPKPTSRLQKFPTSVNALPLLSMEQYMAYTGDTNFGSPLNTNQAVPSYPSAKRTRPTKTGVKSNRRSAKRHSELDQYWVERIHKIRDLAWSLPDAPNDSSGSHLHSIVQEAGQLLQFL